MKKLICCLLLVAFAVTASAQIASLNSKEIATMRKAIKSEKRYQKAFETYKKLAYEALDETPKPITEILSQGLLAGDPRKTASLKAVEDADKTYALALTYKVLDDRKFLDKATEFLLAWAKVNRATDDPINETKIEDMVTAYDLIRNNIRSADRVVIDTWMHGKADAQLESKYAKGSKGTAINNWNSHRIKMVTLIAYTLHDTSYNNAIFRELEKQLNINLNPDGTTHDFIERDAFHYQTYDLEPLISACIAIYRAAGKNYFTWKTANGSSIKNCVDYMVPFMTGEKTHAEFVKSTVPFDLKRAQNNEKGYAAGTLFEPKNGINTLALAAYFDSGYNKIIKQAMLNADYFNWRMALNDFTRSAQ
ncbi:alginate lyase family protein [Mucilaginibacter sp. L3T2-6]|uniref:alginate lyase family protein n=1 Tax=Mucilaginibacter sp. L3T2-6 TaxID=3062491 RepID=UPI00267459F4|nr:alginate lyase family protein [Mucilaginibacter sp. L3T2-6]MDO3643082.1 alginate lyase family protein [Mucilaginibacter sp. L3T2-6]MDV6215849.1 alginate lyase family protein [Mucilaginibacter sp. L3T2-6]